MDTADFFDAAGPRKYTQAHGMAMHIGQQTCPHGCGLRPFLISEGPLGQLPFDSAFVLEANVIRKVEVHRQHWWMQPADGVDKTWGSSRSGCTEKIVPMQSALLLQEPGEIQLQSSSLWALNVAFVSLPKSEATKTTALAW